MPGVTSIASDRPAEPAPAAPTGVREPPGRTARLTGRARPAVRIAEQAGTRARFSAAGAGQTAHVGASHVVRTVTSGYVA